MNKYFLWILLLAIGNSILFYDKEFGLSVILFIIPLLCFLYYVFKEKDLVKNKYGLLLLIPIVLLSLTYFIYNNNFFGIMNLVIIPLLFVIMYIMTVNPSDKIVQFLKAVMILFFKPFKYLDDFCRQLGDYISAKVKVSDKAKRVIKSVVIILPILFIILSLLSSADMIVNSIFSGLFNWLEDIINDFSLYGVIGRLIHMSLLFIYLSLVILFLIKDFSTVETVSKEKTTKDNFTIKLLLTVLNIVYVIFDIIQIKSLVFHSVGDGITYAEYARQGFFQLMFVSLINISIILYSKKYKKEDNKYINIMSIIMVVLTFVIIVSSFLRMNLYEQEYGYTLLRLLVYITLFTEVILLIPTVKYIINPQTKILNYYVVIIVSVYTFINFINIDGVIAERNILRYYDNSKLDLHYLENYSMDNVSCLIKLYDKTVDKKIKKDLKLYLTRLDTSMNGFQEWNVSKWYAKKLIDDKFSA